MVSKQTCDALLDALRDTLRELTGSYGKNTTEQRRARIIARAQSAIVAAENEYEDRVFPLPHGDYRDARGVAPVSPYAESPEARIRHGRGG